MPSQNLPATPDARLPKIPLSDISFEHLAPDHDLLPFSCRQQELNDYLTADALKNQDAHVAVTYPALYDGKCVGYFHLVGQGGPLRKRGEELPVARAVHFRPAGVTL